jgi:hypothetical protein
VVRCFCIRTALIVVTPYSIYLVTPKACVHAAARETTRVVCCSRQLKLTSPTHGEYATVVGLRFYGAGLQTGPRFRCDISWWSAGLVAVVPSSGRGTVDLVSPIYSLRTRIEPFLQFATHNKDEMNRLSYLFLS